MSSISSFILLLDFSKSLISLSCLVACLNLLPRSNKSCTAGTSMSLAQSLISCLSINPVCTASIRESKVLLYLFLSERFIPWAWKRIYNSEGSKADKWSPKSFTNFFIKPLVTLWLCPGMHFFLNFSATSAQLSLPFSPKAAITDPGFKLIPFLSLYLSSTVCMKNSFIWDWLGIISESCLLKIFTSSSTWINFSSFQNLLPPSSLKRFPW